MRMPGIPGMGRPRITCGSSTTLSHSPAAVNRQADSTAPVVEPNPPTTMMIRRLKVRKKVKRLGEMVVMRCARSAAAHPKKEGAHHIGQQAGVGRY